MINLSQTIAGGNSKKPSCR